MYSGNFPSKVGSYTLLLVCLLITMIGLPLLEHSSIGRVLLSFWFFITSVILLASFHGSGRAHQIFLVSGGVFSVILVANLVVQSMNWPSAGFRIVALLYGLIFLAFSTWTILSSIFRAKQVTLDLLSGAVVAYLMLGICWGGLYSIIELTAPGSFSFPDPDGKAGSSLFYFSFVTLTTLGYGDILPIAKIARTAAYLEAVTGVMFTAILIAGLVGNIRRGGSH